MDDRRYRQASYKQSASGKREPPREPRSRDIEGPRSPKMPGTRAVSRCAACGTLWPALTEPFGRCPTCGSERHCCKQCTHFNPGRRFECTQPILERIPDKTARNDCGSFVLRVTVERDTSAGSARPDDARRAFDRLFKK